MVTVYGCNHIAIEVDDITSAVAFYSDVFNLERLSEGEGDAFFKLGEHQFLAMFEVDKVEPARVPATSSRLIGPRRCADRGRSARSVTTKYGIELLPRFRCDFRDPFGNRIQVVDLHDESMVWLLPYREVRDAGITFDGCEHRSAESRPLAAHRRRIMLGTVHAHTDEPLQAPITAPLTTMGTPVLGVPDAVQRTDSPG